MVTPFPPATRWRSGVWHDHTDRPAAARARRNRRRIERQRRRVLPHVIAVPPRVDFIKLELPEWIERVPTGPGRIRVRIDERKMG